MHEKGSFNTKNNIIFNKINNKIKIKEVSLIISESQNLILKTSLPQAGCQQALSKLAASLKFSVQIQHFPLFVTPHFFSLSFLVFLLFLGASLCPSCLGG